VRNAKKLAALSHPYTDVYIPTELGTTHETTYEERLASSTCTFAKSTQGISQSCNYISVLNCTVARVSCEPKCSVGPQVRDHT